ncbi:putative E3 ubiquitin-protein ligase HIP1 isoform X2 [Carex rostrata]
MASQLRSRYNLIPAGPSLIARTNYRRAILTRAASLVGTRSLVRIAVSHHSEQPQNRTSHGQTSNHLQYQELLELEERIGKVNTGIKTSELSKFVKEVICCGEQDEEERCVICLEQYADADVKGQLMCGHEYHFSCIGKWMEEQAVCPICKQRAAQFEQYNC